MNSIGASLAGNSVLHKHKYPCMSSSYSSWIDNKIQYSNVTSDIASLFIGRIFRQKIWSAEVWRGWGTQSNLYRYAVREHSKQKDPRSKISAWHVWDRARSPVWLEWSSQGRWYEKEDRARSCKILKTFKGFGLLLWVQWGATEEGQNLT